MTDEFRDARIPLPNRPWSRDFVRVVSWNIERGFQFAKILSFLRSVEPDLALLQEVDLNARRTHFRDIAGDLARSLSFNFIFGMEFQELSEGARERPAWHGMATLSPWPLSSGRIIRFRDQSAFWKPRWYVPALAVFQRRLGGRIALVSEATVYGSKVATYNLHLESRGGDELRQRQLDEVLVDSRRYAGQARVVVAGDFNLIAGDGQPARALGDAGLHDAVRLSGHATSVAHGLSHHARAIDWIFVAGMGDSLGRIHTDVQASDHYPVSATFPRL